MRYEVIMSNGDSCQIEEEEVMKVLAGSHQKALVMLKRAVINPAHLVAIRPATSIWKGSNISASQREPEKPLVDAFASVRSILKNSRNMTDTLPPGTTIVRPPKAIS